MKQDYIVLAHERDLARERFMKAQRATWDAEREWDEAERRVQRAYAGLVDITHAAKLGAADEQRAQERFCTLCNIRTKPPVCRVPGCPIDFGVGQTGDKNGLIEKPLSDKEKPI